MRSEHPGRLRALHLLLLCGLVCVLQGSAALPIQASPAMVSKADYPFTFAVLGDRTGGAREEVFEQVVGDVLIPGQVKEAA